MKKVIKSSNLTFLFGVYPFSTLVGPGELQSCSLALYGDVYLWPKGRISKNEEFDDSHRKFCTLGKF